MSRRAQLLILSVLALAGCTPKQVIQYKEVKVPVYVYVTVDKRLTAHGDVPNPPKGDDTVLALRSTAYARKLGLMQCYKQLDEISTIHGSPTDGSK